MKNNNNKPVLNGDMDAGVIIHNDNHLKLSIKTSHVVKHSALSCPTILLDSNNITLYLTRLKEILSTHPMIEVNHEAFNQHEIQEIFARLLGFKSWEMLNNLVQKEVLQVPELSSEQSMSRLLELTWPKIVHTKEQFMRREGDTLKIRKKQTLYEALQNKKLIKYPLRWNSVEIFLQELCSGDYLLPLLLLKISEICPSKTLDVFDYFYIYPCKRAFLGYSVDYGVDNPINHPQFIDAFIRIVRATKEKSERGYVYNLAQYGTQIEKVIELLRVVSESQKERHMFDWGEEKTSFCENNENKN